MQALSGSFPLYSPEPARAEDLPAADGELGAVSDLELGLGPETRSTEGAEIEVAIEIDPSEERAELGESIEVEAGPQANSASTPPPAASVTAQPVAPGYLGTEWPATVPGVDMAQQALASELSGSPDPCPAFASATRFTVTRLSRLERAALLDEIEAADPARILRRAAAMRWRLRAALGTVPEPGEGRDEHALEALSRETDRVGAELAALAQATNVADSSAAIEEIRAALVRQAVDFVGALAHAETLPVRAKPRARTGKDAARPRYQPLRWEGGNKTASTRSLAHILAAIAALILAPIAFSPSGEPSLLAPIPGAPVGVVGMQNEGEGTMLVRRLKPELYDPNFEAWLGQLRTEGWAVTEREPHGSGAYVLTRAP